MKYTEEEFIALEQEERKVTDEGIVLLLLLIATLKGNVEDELRKFYQKYGKDGVVTYTEARKWISVQDRRKRLTALTLYLNNEFDSLYSNLTPHFRDFLITVIGKEQEFFGVKLDTDEVEKILSDKWGADDSTWSDRLKDDVGLWFFYILNDIKRAIVKQQHINDVLKQIDKRFGSIESIIKKLGLTESTAIGSLARQRMFKNLGVTKYQFYTKPDERRCEICGSMHGLIFPISAYEVGVTASPIHPHCRCWEVPIIG